MTRDIEVAGQEQIRDGRALLPWQANLSTLPSEPLAWRPGRMPIPCYMGIWAHYLIGRYYQLANPGHRTLVDVDVGRIIFAAGGAVPRRADRVRPDLIDYSLLQIWEIKSSGQILEGGPQMEVYRNLLGRDFPVQPGSPRRGTEGKVFAPGGHVGFLVRLPGVIRYDYIRSTP